MLKFSQMAVFCGAAALTAAAGGCQRGQTWQLAAVEGTVTRKGQPLEGVQVVFWPAAAEQGPRASGFTNAAGRYELRTDAGDRGAAIGRYRVCLLAPRKPDLNQRTNRPRTRPAELQENGMDASSASDVARVPLNYGSVAKTPLRVEVRSDGIQTFDFDVPDGPPNQKLGRP